MNYVVHMISQVRLRIDERSRALVERKQREGKTLRWPCRAPHVDHIPQLVTRV